MSLIKREFPFTNASDFFDFDEEWFPARTLKTSWSHAINIVDNDDGYEIEIAAPGLKKKDFALSIERGILTINGHTESEKEEKKKNYTRKEFSSKSFTKSFTLPDDVDEDRMKAKYDDGILKLTLPKTEKSVPEKKEIKIA